MVGYKFEFGSIGSDVIGRVVAPTPKPQVWLSDEAKEILGWNKPAVPGYNPK